LELQYFVSLPFVNQLMAVPNRGFTWPGDFLGEILFCVG